MRKIPSSELLHNGFIDIFEPYKNGLSMPMEKLVSSFPRVENKIPLRTGISGRIYYTSIVSSLTDEYAEDTILKTADVANVLRTNVLDIPIETDILHNEILQIIDGTTPHYDTYNSLVSMVAGLGGGSVFVTGGENGGNVNFAFIVLSFAVCFISYFHHQLIVHNGAKEKLGDFIDIKQIKQNTKIFMLVLFMVLSRNVNSVS